LGNNLYEFFKKLRAEAKFLVGFGLGHNKGMLDKMGKLR